MARKPSSKPPKNTGTQTALAPPPHVTVGLPQLPALYGLKPRPQYLPWSHAEERLARSRNYWICTTRPDGRPHSIPVWGLWLEGAL